MKKSTIVFSAVNAIGMLICLAFVTGAYRQAVTEQRDSYDFGDSLNFFLFVQPVLGVCLLLNIVWGVMALVAVVRGRGYRSALACVVVVALWAAVFLLARGIASLPLNPAAPGNGATARLFHAGRLSRAVPEPRCWP
jgi:hypothetical protein